jgi:hypothetical protein
MSNRRIVHFLTLVAALVAAPFGAAATLIPVQTKAQAERNVLRVVPHSWKASRMPGLIDPKTHLLVNNTEAICYGRGTAHGGRRYPRFVCVVQPPMHRPHAGLYVSYRALLHGRFRVRWIAYRR